MKIELKSGAIIHVDNPQELKAILLILNETESTAETWPQPIPLNVEAKLAGETERVKAFFRSVNANARKFMLFLIAYKNGIKGEAFAENSGFQPEKFGGIMGGIEKQAKNQKLRREEFIISVQKFDGTSRYRFLQPGDLLVKHEIDLHKIIKQEGESEAVSVGA